ncbi:MAG: C4-dicarboxylate transporter substrate-binding protein [Acidobacteria bacterium]|jgi:TRAP transporter TAXI family solute receptor|nr:C4-dicarboxylate transporter substrate-binding protein [Acidobacteriota bacterium]
MVKRLSERLRWAVAIVLAACASACARPAAAPTRHTLRIGTGAQRGNYYPVGVALARTFAMAMPDVDAEVTVTAGTMANLEALRNGSADVVFSFADVAYAAYVGGPGDRREPFTGLRALALLQLLPVQLVVSDRSSVHGVTDLPGRNVIYVGGNTGAAAERIMRAYGVDPASILLQQTHSFEDSIVDLSSGKLDAMFVLSRYPVDNVSGALERGSHLMPLAGDPIERLHREYPFFRPMLIAGGAYPNQSQPVRTIGIHSLLLCRVDLDEGLVYRLTKALFESLAEQSNELLWSVDLERAAATPIPLHAGAARYHRERELFP